MEDAITCQGREITISELKWLRNWIAKNSGWSINRLTVELCRIWNWYTHTGHLKTFAGRSFLFKLQQRGLISLPPIRVQFRPHHSCPIPTIPMSVTKSEPMCSQPSELTPLSVIIPEPGSFEESCFRWYLSTHHYLGYHSVGENIKYLVRDRHGRDLACLLFGSAAWKTAPRDAFIGWSDATRQSNINLMTNNTRFLILPWIKVPHLASHILGLVMRRIVADWQNKYAHPIHLVETFVERNRFKGTCYKAANWICVGQTKGRGRQDRYSACSVPVKDIFLYPVNLNFRQALSSSPEVSHV